MKREMGQLTYELKYCSCVCLIQSLFKLIKLNIQKLQKSDITNFAAVTVFSW